MITTLHCGLSPVHVKRHSAHLGRAARGRGPGVSRPRRSLVRRSPHRWNRGPDEKRFRSGRAERPRDPRRTSPRPRGGRGRRAAHAARASRSASMRCDRRSRGSTTPRTLNNRSVDKQCGHLPALTVASRSRYSLPRLGEAGEPETCSTRWLFEILRRETEARRRSGGRRRSVRRAESDAAEAALEGAHALGKPPVPSMCRHGRNTSHREAPEASDRCGTNPVRTWTSRSRPTHEGQPQAADHVAHASAERRGGGGRRRRESASVDERAGAPRQRFRRGARDGKRHGAPSGARRRRVRCSFGCSGPPERRAMGVERRSAWPCGPQSMGPGCNAVKRSPGGRAATRERTANPTGWPLRAKKPHEWQRSSRSRSGRGGNRRGGERPRGRNVPGEASPGEADPVAHVTEGAPEPQEGSREPEGFRPAVRHAP